VLSVGRRRPPGTSGFHHVHISQGHYRDEVRQIDFAARSFITAISVTDSTARARAVICVSVRPAKLHTQHEVEAQGRPSKSTSCPLAIVMTWPLGFIAPLFVFAALIGFLVKARRRVPSPIQSRSESRDDEHPLAPRTAPEPIIQAVPETTGVQSVFEKLRVAVERRDANLFEPLHVALVHLIEAGGSHKVHTHSIPCRPIYSRLFKSGLPRYQ